APAPDGGGGCLGCIDSTGHCVSGRADDACYVGTMLCAACPTGQSCGNGMCTAPPACTPSNCTGCCQGDSCVAGTGADACGTGGLAWQTCISGAACTLGVCQFPCGPDTCGGCCDSA